MLDWIKSKYRKTPDPQRARDELLGEHIDSVTREILPFLCDTLDYAATQPNPLHRQIIENFAATTGNFFELLSKSHGATGFARMRLMPEFMKKAQAMEIAMKAFDAVVPELVDFESFRAKGEALSVVIQKAFTDLQKL